MSKKRRIGVVSLILVVLMMISTSGYSSAVASTTEHEKVTLTIIHEHSPEAAANIVSSAGFRAMMDKFKAEHPWVTLEETIVSNADIGKKYQTLIAADELPDITYVKYPWLTSMAGGGMLADLTKYVKVNDYIDKCFAVTYKGKVYGMENKFSLENLIYYNEKMWKDAGFAKFPTTMDGLIAAGKVFASKGITAISLGNTAKWFAVAYFASPLLYDYCGNAWVTSMLRMENKYHWTDACFIKAMTELQKLGPLLNKDFNMQDDIWAANWYMQGNSAAHAVGSWGLDTLKNLGTKYPEVWKNTRVALVPPGNKAAPTVITAVGAAVGVSSRLKGAKLEAAIQFCQQISSKDYANFMAAKGATAPVKTKLDFTGKPQPYLDFAAILNSPKASGLHFNDYFNQTMITVFQQEVQALLAGTETPVAVAKKMQATQNSLKK